MADSLSPEKRSWNMSRIRSTETSIEVKVRKYLFSRGFRYRKNDKRLPGKPDIVLPKYRTVVFIHGCFWHRHPGCKIATIPKTNTEYWLNKFAHNTLNDIKNQELLKSCGWDVIILWQCDIEKRFEQTMQDTVAVLTSKMEGNEELKNDTETLWRT